MTGLCCRRTCHFSLCRSQVGVYMASSFGWVFLVCMAGCFAGRCCIEVSTWCPRQAAALFCCAALTSPGAALPEPSPLCSCGSSAPAWGIALNQSAPHAQCSDSPERVSTGTAGLDSYCERHLSTAMSDCPAKRKGTSRDTTLRGDFLLPNVVQGHASEGTHAAVTKYTAQVYPVHKPNLGWLHMHKGELASPVEAECMYSGILHEIGQVLVMLPCLLWVVHPADELKLVYASVMHGLQQAKTPSRTAASSSSGPHDTPLRSIVWTNDVMKVRGTYIAWTYYSPSPVPHVYIIAVVHAITNKSVANALLPLLELL